MAAILQNGNGDNKTFTIAGLTTTQFFTIYDIIETERNKAADPLNKDYDEESANKVIAIYNTINEGFKNKVKI